MKITCKKGCNIRKKAGDEMLCSIADAMQEVFPHRLTYRIGGDEFVVLCPEQGEMIDMTYQKKDGNWISLKITIYDQNDADNEEMQWIFVDAN